MIEVYTNIFSFFPILLLSIIIGCLSFSDVSIVLFLLLMECKGFVSTCVIKSRASIINRIIKLFMVQCRLLTFSSK